MEYTKYFAFVIKEKGQPNLSSSEFRRMMNIVHLEGKISGLKQVKESLKGTEQFYKYDIFISKTLDQLKAETENTTPVELFESMVKNSID